MVPLIEKSSNILVVKVGEYANSGESVELFRWNYTFLYGTVLHSLVPHFPMYMHVHPIGCMVALQWKVWCPLPLAAMWVSRMERLTNWLKLPAIYFNPSRSQMIILLISCFSFCVSWAYPHYITLAPVMIIFFLYLYLANFPWLEPLILQIIRKENFSQSVFLLHKTALTLVQERMKSQQSPKVFTSHPPTH